MNDSSFLCIKEGFVRETKRRKEGGLLYEGERVNTCYTDESGRNIVLYSYMDSGGSPVHKRED